MYKQLQKLTGTENENASVDASTQSTQVMSLGGHPFVMSSIPRGGPNKADAHGQGREDGGLAERGLPQ